MMIVSAKVSKRKLLTGLIVAVGIILLLVFLCGRADAGVTEPSEDNQVTAEVSTNQQRLAFLQSFGWEVSETPHETQEVRIPETFNEVFSRYNRLQQSQGYDLSAWAGQTVKRYVYAIRNYPGGGDASATLLVDGNAVIGGDVRSGAEGGTMHGFQRPMPTEAGS